MRQRAVRSFWFGVVWRRRRYPQRLFRCHECRSLTDDPQGHAEYHAGVVQRPPNPSCSGETISVDVDVSDLPAPRR